MVFMVVITLCLEEVVLGWFQICSNIFLFSPLHGEDLHFEYIIFFDWVKILKPPTSGCLGKELFVLHILHKEFWNGLWVDECFNERLQHCVGLCFSHIDLSESNH